MSRRKALFDVRWRKTFRADGGMRRLSRHLNIDIFLST